MASVSRTAGLQPAGDPACTAECGSGAPAASKEATTSPSPTLTARPENHRGPRRRLGAALVLGLAVSLLPACRQPETTPLKIAVSLSFGIDGNGQPTSVPGAQRFRAMELAMKEVHHQVRGRRVELLLLDSGVNDADEQKAELVAVRAAIADPAVIAYIGPLTSNQARISLPLLNQASIVQVGFSTTWPGFTRPGFAPGEPGIHYPTGRRHFFRVVPTDDVQARLAARWAHQLGFRSVYLVDDGTPYGRGVGGIFADAAGDLGLQVVESYSAPRFNDPEVFVSRVVPRVLATAPDLLYYAGGINEFGVCLLTSVREARPQQALMMPDAAFEVAMDEDPFRNLLSGLYATLVSVPTSQLSSPEAQHFVDAFQDRYGQAPTPMEANIFEALMVVLRAMELAPELSRKGVLRGMEQLGEYHGVLGTWHFDANGDATLESFSGMQLSDGIWHYLDTLH